MADEQADASKNKGKMKLLLIIIVAVIVLGGAAAAFLLMGSNDTDEPSSNVAPVSSSEVDEPVVYVSLPQPFVFNVTGDKRDRMVQIKVQLMVRGTDSERLARYHSPLIESSLLSTFASATVEQLRTPDGRVQLRKKATEDIQAVLRRAVGQPVIERVLFTDFVMQ